MNSRTTPASITSEPRTASLPIEPVSQAPTLALTENVLPSPTSTDALNEYQSRKSVPISVTIVPPVTIHVLRVILDMSIRAVSLPDELRGRRGIRRPRPDSWY